MPQKQKIAGEIRPEKITKPIQLLATWFLSLVLIDGAFFGAAKMLEGFPWIVWFLVLAAILNVYTFVYCVFRLQTKFRAQIQEDSYYSKFLGKVETATPQMREFRTVIAELNSASIERARELQNHIVELSQIVALLQEGKRAHVRPEVKQFEKWAETAETALSIKQRWTQYRISVNDLIPQYGNVTRFLEEKGVARFETFGSTSDPPKTPEIFTFSFGAGVDVVTLQEAVRFLAKEGLTAIDYAEDEDRTFHYGRLYIGSYGYRDSTVTMLTKDLLQELVRPGVALGEFLQLVRTNSVEAKLKNSSAVVAGLVP